MGPLQCALPLMQGVGLMELAFSYGVNFVDTAESYGTYPYIKEAIKLKPDLVVSTKSYAYDAKTAQESFKKAVEGIGREYIDIFMLHEQESEHTIRGHMAALEYYLSKKEEGLIGAVGLSTHFVAGIHGANKYEEIDVIHPLINKAGFGICDGDADAMLREMRTAHANGKGVFAMKPLAGGHLIQNRGEAFEFILSLDCVDAVATGMQSEAEVRFNCAVFSGDAPSSADEAAIGQRTRRLLIHDWCRGCGACVKKCKQGALSLLDGKARVDMAKCVMCGYCGRVCPDFCIKII
jgi:aryl-alcohol dehydrogenase-like predicted oxidoreductase